MANTITRASRRASVWGLKKFGGFLLKKSPSIMIASVLLTVWGVEVERTASVRAFHQAEIWCLATNLYWEARNDASQTLVGVVTRERVRSRLYPSRYCEVVYQEKQFSWTLTSAISREPANRLAWKRALSTAREIYAGRHDFPKSWNCRPLFYKRGDDKATTKNGRAFFKKLVPVGQIGAHRFYCLKKKAGHVVQRRVAARPTFRPADLVATSSQ